MLRTSRGAPRLPARAEAPLAWWIAAGIVATELIAALAGWSSLPLAGAALLAPGLALAGLLPGRPRATPIARLAAAPALGLALTSVALITITQLGVALSPVSVHVVLALLLVVGLFVPTGQAEQPDGHTARERRAGIALDAVVLVACVALTVVLGWRVIGQLPVPGDDWAKYLLYADEIRHQGKLLLQNTLWMGGRPFSEDPGMPALEGSALLMTGSAAGGLVRTILILQVLGVMAAFGAALASFGRTGAAVTGLLIAIVPATQNILGWHGLANVGALAMVPLALASLGAWLDGELDRRGQLGFALTLLGIVAAHRFTTLFVAGTVALVLAVGLLLPERRTLLPAAVRTGAIGLAAGIPLALDLRTRAADAGGTLSYTSYLGTKVDLVLALRDLSWLLVGAAILATLVLVSRRALPRSAWPALAMAIVTVGLAFGYVAHVPLYYARTTFFLPLPLAILAGAGAGAFAAWAADRMRVRGRMPDSRMLVALGAAGALTGAVLGVQAVRSWDQAEQVRGYYAFASPDSLTALDDLATELRPGEIVVTDRCWSFLATWLLHTRTYPALEEQDIQPKAELRVARASEAILRGTTEGRALMRSLPVRFAAFDPTCPVNGKRFFPPGTPLYAGGRLAILQLDPDGPDRTPKPSKKKK
ncbi:MAG: hypothetical protein J7513_07865 [Solirubrobacteraceae bacterium]|nr:hypothetical protein [Solirubrobacteraceae bacterium]